MPPPLVPTELEALMVFCCAACCIRCCKALSWVEVLVDLPFCADKPRCGSEYVGILLYGNGRRPAFKGCSTSHGGVLLRNGLLPLQCVQ